MPRAIVVVPCFNESKRLDVGAVLDFGRQAEGVELLFVNDGSRDETLDVLEYLHAANPRRFSFLHLARNGGKAEAVRQGVLLAIRSGANYVGYWDADLATPLAEIEGFRRVLDDKPHIDAVIGTRMRLLGHAIERRPLRYLLGRVFANTASLALGLRIFDTQCGAKMFRVTPHVAELFTRPFLARWIFDVEILARLKLARRSAGLAPVRETIYEVPLDRWRDVAGSSVKGGDFMKAFFQMARIWWTYLRPGARHPTIAAQPSPGTGVPAQPRRAKQGDQKAA